MTVQEFGHFAEEVDASFDAIDIGLVLLNKSLLLSRWNRAFEAMRLVDPSVLHVGMPLQDLLFAAFRPMPSPQTQSNRFLRSIAPGERPANDTLQFSDGAEISLRRAALPGGGYCLQFRDITEERMAQRQLARSVKLEAVGRMMAGVAHDMNNLLAIIIGNLELVQEGYDIASNKDLINASLKSASQGADLATRLLSFAKQKPLSPKSVKPCQMITGLTEVLRAVLQERGRLAILTSTDLWPVRVDVSGLENVIVNLAINARDAMPKDGMFRIEGANQRVNATQAAELDLAEGRYVRLAFSDTGTGMSPAVKVQVFEPFFSTKAPGEGSGLGLSMAHGFLKQSGGTIEIESVVGQGTTVFLYIPADET